MKMTQRNLAILKQRLKKFVKANKELAGLKASPNHWDHGPEIESLENHVDGQYGLGWRADYDLTEMKGQSNGKGSSHDGLIDDGFWKTLVRDGNKINSIHINPGSHRYILTTFNHVEGAYDISSHATSWEMTVAEYKYWLSVYPL